MATIVISLLAIGVILVAHGGGRGAPTTSVRQADHTLSAPWQDASPHELDASNALTLPGSHGDFDLSASIRLAPGALLEVRTRARDPRYAHGVALMLPAAGDERQLDGARWMEQDVAVFDPIGPEGGHAPVERWVELEIEVRGTRFAAWLEAEGVRQPVAQGETRSHPAGAVVLLAARGQLEVRAVDLVPVTPAATTIGGVGDRLVGLLPFAVLAVIWRLVTALLLGLSRSQSFQAALLAVPVLAVVLAWQGMAATLSAELVALAAVAASVWMMLHAAAHTKRRGALRLVGAAGVALLSTCLVFGAAVDRPVPRDARYVNRLGWASRGDELVDWNRPHLEHPYLRRWNHYLAEHRLHGRRFSRVAPEGTRRVLCLGGSSTWGYRLPLASALDYPSRLEQLLASPGAWGAAEPAPVEVLNGAVLAATGARQFVVLRDALLAFEPDVVVVDLFYNDAFALTRGDELAHALDPPRPPALPWPLSRLLAADHWENERGRRRLADLLVAFGRRGAPSAALWPSAAPLSPPPERFEAVLVAIAELCREQGIRLVLVQEPLADDKPFLWKQEFRASMNEVGQRFGVPVVDPTPALQAAGGAELFMDQVHLTPEGHEVMAQQLVPVIVEQLTR